MRFLLILLAALLISATCLPSAEKVYMVRGGQFGSHAADSDEPVRGEHVSRSGKDYTYGISHRRRRTATPGLHLQEDARQHRQLAMDNEDDAFADDDDDNNMDDTIEVSGSSHSGGPDISGTYRRSYDINRRAHYERSMQRTHGTGYSRVVHLYWNGTQWVMSHTVDADDDHTACLAYSKVSHAQPTRTSRLWFVKSGASGWAPKPMIRLSPVKHQQKHHTHTRRGKLTRQQGFRDLDFHDESESDDELVQEPFLSDLPYEQDAQEEHGSFEYEPKFEHDSTTSSSTSSSSATLAVDEHLMKKRLTPLYVLFVLDSICSGIALPALPFFVMGLGASAFQLSVVVSANYVAQTIGCTVMGGISDRFGRKPVIVGCLLGSLLSNLAISQSKSLKQVAFARVIGGIMGGMTPIAQSVVADTIPVDLRPKFIGRLQACVGLGFVLGPILVLILNKLFQISTKATFIAAAMFPLCGLLVALGRLKESKPKLDLQTESLSRFMHHMTDTTENTLNDEPSFKSGPSVPGDITTSPALQQTANTAVAAAVLRADAIPSQVLLLVGNGFLLMYAFSIETIYAMFLKDNFGYGHAALSTLFAVNGVMVGVLQLVFMRHLVQKLGKHMLLVIGNLLLASGMLGLSLVRNRPIHFALFSLHIIGYSMADTALVSLISRYAGINAQGRSLGLNQAAQSIARVVSPLIAGALYTHSQRAGSKLPAGALPYILGSAMPLLAITVPLLLYMRTVEAKRLAKLLST